MTGFPALAVVVGYAVALLGIGGYFVRRQRDSEAFFLGNRSLSAVQVFGTTFSTFLGPGLLFTLAAFGYRFGVGAFVLPGAAVVGLVLLASAAPRLKGMSDRGEAITLPSLMDRDWSDRTQALAAVVTAGLFTGTLGANLLVVGDVLRVFLGVRPVLGIAAFAGLVVAYTVLGGFRAVVWTDVAQTGLIILSVVVILPVLAFGAASAGDLGTLPPDHLDPSALPVPVLVVYLLVGVFAFFGSQDLFQRVFAARGPAEARRGFLAFAVTLAVVGTVAVGLGVVARAALPPVAPDRALLLLAAEVTPVGLVGAVAVGVLALANSDADSQLLTVASNLTQDLAPAGDSLHDNQRVAVDRLAATVVGTGAALVAIFAPGLTALFGALGSWFAVLGFVVVATLYWDRTTDAAAFWGLTVGFLAHGLFVLATGNFGTAPVVGLVPTAAVLVAVSLLGRPAE